MIDIDDLKIPGTDVFKNKLGITDRGKLASAEADFTAIRLTQLNRKPLVGAFTTEHLQGIHNYVFQDVYEWAGRLRDRDLPERLAQLSAPPHEIEKALNRVLDRLSSENHLKGCEPVAWIERSGYYLTELSQIQPFPTGNELVVEEFTRELAQENNIWLRWDRITKDHITGELNSSMQRSRGANLRRLIMLALDPEPVKHHHTRDLLRNMDHLRGREFGFTKY